MTLTDSGTAMTFEIAKDTNIIGKYFIVIRGSVED